MQKIEYSDFLRDHEKEVLQEAVNAIQPDVMQMDRNQALTLAGAMKNCGFTSEDFAEVMSRSSADKGTFAKQWNKFRGSGQHGEATKATIYDYAKKCGWKWPTPYTEEPGATEQKRNEKNNKSNLVKQMQEDFKLSCIVDNVAYNQKPTNVGEIRKREQVPTPTPVPQSPIEFAQAIASGHTFYPTVYNKELTGKDENGKPIYKYNALYQQIFIVDIDNEEQYIDDNGKRQKRAIEEPLTIDAAMEICNKNDIAPFFVYETFSSKEHRAAEHNPYYKFRLCFVLDKPITVQQWGEVGINKAINYFIDLFGAAADHKTIDPARLIYGTNEKENAHLYRNVIDSKNFMQLIFKPETEETEEPAESKEELLPVGNYIDLFRKHREETKNNIRTGINELDIALGGGFGPELYILGAETGTGKSAIASFIAQNIAKNGIDVLYFALEMGRDEFIARGISAISVENGNKPIKYSEILNDTYDYSLKAFTRRPYKQYEEYAKEYANRYGQHLYILEGGINGKCAREIVETAKEFKEQNNLKQMVVFIDYLQLLSADKNDRSQRDMMGIISAAVKTLKALASQNGITVFLISSMANDRKGQRVNDASFKYSGDIGYTGGVLLGWNWKGVTVAADEETRKRTLAECKQTGKRDMILEVIKNRSGERDLKVNLTYKPAYNYISEPDFEPATEKEMDIFKDIRK